MKTLLELEDQFFDGKDADTVKVAAVIFGSPGIDIWVNGKNLALDLDATKKLRDFLNENFPR